MDKTKKAEEIYGVLAVTLRTILGKAKLDFEKMQEIRLRMGAPLGIIYDGKEFFVDREGRLTGKAEEGYVVQYGQIRETIEYISNYSLYAFEEELRQGYITVKGGHRIGVAGRMIWERQGAKNLKHISFINIRLAHQVVGCAGKVLPYIRQGSSICHTLIISPPRCGKTTLLRDLIRQLSNGDENYPGVTVGVVDERSELGACYMGKPQNDLGCRTDILDNCPKVEGMMMLVRSMAPQVIAVDEVGSREDVEAMEYVMNSGIHLVATVHGNTIDEIKNKPILGELVREKVFQRYILLEAGKIGCVENIFDERGTSLLGRERIPAFTGRYAC